MSREHVFICSPTEIMLIFFSYDNDHTRILVKSAIFCLSRYMSYKMQQKNMFVKSKTVVKSNKTFKNTGKHAKCCSHLQQNIQYFQGNIACFMKSVYSSRNNTCYDRICIFPQGLLYLPPTYAEPIDLSKVLVSAPRELSTYCSDCYGCMVSIHSKNH